MKRERWVDANGQFVYEAGSRRNAREGLTKEEFEATVMLLSGTVTRSDGRVFRAPFHKEGLSVSTATPSPVQLFDACLYYRHDFGMLGDEEREKVELEAKEWYYAWQKAMNAGGKR